MLLSVSTPVRARILSLYQQDKDIQTIAEATQTPPETVEAVVKEAAEKSRIVYVFADREEPATVIDVCHFGEYLRKILTVDALFLNEDRHFHGRKTQEGMDETTGWPQMMKEKWGQQKGFGKKCILKISTGITISAIQMTV